MNSMLLIIIALVMALAVVMPTLIHGIHIVSPGKGTASTSVKYSSNVFYFAKI